MINFILIFFCILAGMLLRYTKSIHPEAHKGINTWIIYIGLPAISFRYIPEIEWSPAMFFPGAGPLIVMIFSLILVRLYCRYNGYSKRTKATLELATGYSNTSFLGFPLIAAYYGEQFISVGIISDQINFILVSSIGLISAVKAGNNQINLPPYYVIRRLLIFPPFIGTFLALFLSFFVDLTFTFPFFDKLALTVVPLALFSIGLQLKFNGWKKQFYQVSTAISYKLLLAPLLVILAAFLFNQQGTIAKVSVLEAAMPTLVTSSIIAEQFKLNTRLLNLIIGIGIPLSFLTSALWYLIMEIAL